MMRKEIKDTEIGNEDVKVSISKENMILYLKDPNDSVRDLGPCTHFP